VTSTIGGADMNKAELNEVLSENNPSTATDLGVIRYCQVTVTFAPAVQR